MRIGEANKGNYRISFQTPSKDVKSTSKAEEHTDEALQKAPDEITEADIDEVTISNGSIAKAKEENNLSDALEKMRAESRELQRQLEAAREQGDGMADYFKKKLQCIIIAMRIMQGDKVPPEDHRFLAEEEPELYHKAMSMRVEKEDPEEYDRLSEDEENDSKAPDNGEAEPVQGGSREAALTADSVVDSVPV
ncbi:MAG: hypothetical protein FWH33_06005 [Oscillospiraceae bacterium]|nr:hypothetical protein [Oscillospiraceae bacterium]